MFSTLRAAYPAHAPLPPPFPNPTRAPCSTRLTGAACAGKPNITRAERAGCVACHEIDVADTEGCTSCSRAPGLREEWSRHCATCSSLKPLQKGCYQCVARARAQGNWCGRLTVDAFLGSVTPQMKAALPAYYSCVIGAGGMTNVQTGCRLAASCAACLDAKKDVIGKCMACMQAGKGQLTKAKACHESYRQAWGRPLAEYWAGC